MLRARAGFLFRPLRTDCARGTGPLLSTLAAITLLGERPSLLALAGGVVIITAIFVLTGGPRLFHEDRPICVT